MERNRLKISVALCTYNGERFLQEQLDSIICQTIKVDQIVISDDNSSDNTMDIINDFKSMHQDEFAISIIQNTPGLGVVKNFETAMKACDGDIIFTSDQDDIWVKDKVEKILEVFSTHNVELVFSDALLINESGFSLNKTMWNTLRFEYKNSNSTRELIIRKNVVTGATMAVRRELFLRACPFIEDNSMLLHDYWLALNAKELIFGIKECLVKYRQHDANVVGANHKKNISINKITTNNYKNIIENEYLSFSDKYYKYVEREVDKHSNKELKIQYDFYKCRKLVDNGNTSFLSLIRLRYFYIDKYILRIIISMLSMIQNRRKLK